MSQLISMATSVQDREILSETCAKLKKEGHAIVGPRYVEGHQMRNGKTLNGYAVRLPGWQRDVVFPCDGSKLLDADNWSEFFDNREIDLVTGERIAGTGTVHPEVLAGRKQPGEDGRWGDIEELNRLNREYLVTAYEETAAETGDFITRTENVDGSIELEIQHVEVAA